MADCILKASKWLKMTWRRKNISFPQSIEKFLFHMFLQRGGEGGKRGRFAERIGGEIWTAQRDCWKTADPGERSLCQSFTDVLPWNRRVCVVTVSHCSSQLERKEPAAENENHFVDASVAGKQLCYCKGYVTECCCRPTCFPIFL